jgi:hypothetical protein
MIKLKSLLEIAPSVVKEGGKLFGSRAQRVSTEEMNVVYNDLQNALGDKFSKFKLSKALPSKIDHGDIDIVNENGEEEINNHEGTTSSVQYNSGIEDFFGGS